MKSLTATAVSGALVTTGILLLPTPALAVDTCLGQPATIVGGPGLVMGTDGNDVILATNADVRALGGDDLICLTGDQGNVADAGSGNDTVNAASSTKYSVVSLGEGQDTFSGGGPGEDVVYGSAPEGLGDNGLNPLDTERDVIATGRGDDHVFSGSVGAPNADDIRTGPGDDRIDVVGLDPTLTLDAGAGDNSAIVTLTAPTTTAWEIDVTRRKIHVDRYVDETTSHWRGQLHRWYFTMADGQAASSLVFLGTAADEAAFVSGDGLVPHFRMAGGNDWAGSLTVRGGTFRMGPGRDRLTVGKYDGRVPGFPLDRMRIDLAQQRIDFDGDVASVMSGVEILKAGAKRLRIYGSRQPERIIANGCRVEVHGGPGNDVLTRVGTSVFTCSAVESLLFGNGGNDLLIGTAHTDDLLVGGLGFDRARGMGGTDTCRAEVTRGCELR